MRIRDDFRQTLINEGARADVFVQFFEDFLIQMAAQLKELCLYLRLFVEFVDVSLREADVQASGLDGFPVGQKI